LCAIMCNKQVNNVIKLENCQLPCKFPCPYTMVAKVSLSEAYPGALVYGLKLKFYTMLQMHHVFVGRIAYKKCRDAAYCYRCSMGLCVCYVITVKPYKNGPIDPDAVWVVDSDEPEKLCR